MDMAIRVLIALSALAFLLAIASTFVAGGTIFNTVAEAYSRASTNFALLAIALAVAPKSSLTT